MNVKFFIPIIQNFHGHNFQKSYRIVTLMGKMLRVDTKISGCKTYTDKPKKTHVISYKCVVRLWWKFLLCLHHKSLTFLFGLCSSSLLRKSSTFCCILFYVVYTCVFLFWRIHPFRC